MSIEKLIIYDNKYVCISKNITEEDFKGKNILNLKPNTKLYITLDRCVAFDHIYENTIYYYYYDDDDFKPTGYMLERPAFLSLTFNSHLFATSEENLEIIIKLSRWFGVKRHNSVNQYKRQFYDKNNNMITFNEDTQLFSYIHMDMEEEEEDLTYDELQQHYVEDIFFLHDVKLSNSHLIIDDKYYCMNNKYIDIEENIFSDNEKSILVPNCKKIYHIIYPNEYVIELYLDTSCIVTITENTLNFSNNEYYGSYEDFINKTPTIINHKGFGLYPIPKYFM